MKIEEVIQQKNFESEAHRAVINIMHTATYIQQLHNTVFKPHKISGQQYNALRIINGQFPKPASVQIINERMIDKASNGSRIVDKLVEKGLVSRKVCSADRRQVEIFLTAKAKELIQKVHKELQAAMAGLQTIDKKELEQLNNGLDQIRITTKSNTK